MLDTADVADKRLGGKVLRAASIALTLWGMAVAGTPNVALAEADLNSGNALLGQCTNSSALERGVCFGRVDGFINGYEMASTEARIICRPNNTTLGQLVDIVKKELTEHPERRQAPWQSLALLALNNAFPCQNGANVKYNPRTGGVYFTLPAKPPKP